MPVSRAIIAILRGITPGETAGVVGALVEAGIGMIEIPLNSPDPLASIEDAARRYSGSAEIGAGTVLTPEAAQQVADAGGTFIVSPDTNVGVIARSKELGLGSYPGVFSPTEAFAAIRAGADALKFFPAEILGTSGIKAMKAVLPPALPLYAVGGANPDNFAAYIAAGCTGFGLGTYLFRPGMTVAEVGERARRAINALEEARS